VNLRTVPRLTVSLSASTHHEAAELTMKFLHVASKTFRGGNCICPLGDVTPGKEHLPYFNRQSTD
jgi:hypothetical protein